MTVKNIWYEFRDLGVHATFLHILGKLNGNIKPWQRYTDTLPDEKYLKVIWEKRMGYPLDLEHPCTFNEKLQWLKLHDRRNEYTMMVDKYKVRNYIKEKIGEKYLVPLLGVWENPEDIDFDSLPNQFVLKCNHNSGIGMCICTNKSKLNIEEIRKKLKYGISQDFYFMSREWPYKNVPRRIIAEKYMTNKSGDGLSDYKFFCFDGIAKIMFVASDRQEKNEETKFDFFDMNFHHLPFTNGHPNAEHKIERPQSFERMRRLAEKLSEGIPQVRCDFYDIDGQIYFGEMTFFHWGGLVPFEPSEWDQKLGAWIHLPESN